MSENSEIVCKNSFKNEYRMETHIPLFAKWLYFQYIDVCI